MTIGLIVAWFFYVGVHNWVTLTAMYQLPWYLLFTWFLALQQLALIAVLIAQTMAKPIAVIWAGWSSWEWSSSP